MPGLGAHGRSRRYPSRRKQLEFMMVHGGRMASSSRLTRTGRQSLRQEPCAAIGRNADVPKESPTMSKSPQDLERIVAVAAELDSPGERARFLSEACGSDAELCAQAECLLGAMTVDRHMLADHVFRAVRRRKGGGGRNRAYHRPLEASGADRRRGNGRRLCRRAVTSDSPECGAQDHQAGLGHVR